MIHAVTVFGQVAIGELPSAYDLSVPNPLHLLTKLPADALTTYCMVATPYNPATGAEVRVALSNNGYRSAPTDNQPDVYYYGILSEPYSANVSIVSRGRITGRATPVFGEITILNPNGDFDYLMNYRWDARDITIYLGRKDQPFDTGFSPLFIGRVEDIIEDLERIRIKIRSLDIKMDTPVQENKYMGIGWALRFDGTDDEVNFGTNLDRTGANSFTAEVLFRSTNTGVQQFIFGKRAGLDATDEGWGLHVGTDDKARFVVCDGTTAYSASTSSTVMDGEWHRLTGIYDVLADTVTIYDDGTQGTSTSTSGAGSFSTIIGSVDSVNLTAGEHSGGAKDLTGDLTDLRFWSIARTAAQITNDMHRPLSQSETGLVGYWPCDEGIGNTVTDNIGSKDGTITPAGSAGGATWIGTGEGGAELAGKCKPLVYGEAYGVTPILIDPKYLVYQVHDGAVSSIAAVRDGGVVLTDEGNVADIWNTSVTSGYFKTDETNGFLRLGGDPASIVECDVLGDATGSYIDTAGAIMRRIAARHGALTDPDDISLQEFSDLETDAPYTVGIVTGLDPVLRSNLLDDLAESVGGWWGFTRQGLLIAGILKVPEDETPTVEFNLADLEEYGLTATSVPVPTYEQRIGYARQWTVLRRTDLATSLTGSDLADAMQALTQEYRYQRSIDESVKTTHLDAWSETVDTLISGAGDAQTEAARRMDLFGISRMVYRVPLVQGIWAADIGDIVCLRFPRMGLFFGQNFVVAGWEEDGNLHKQSLMLWGARTLAPDVRITQEGDIRVTQEDDIRITT